LKKADARQIDIDGRLPLVICSRALLCRARILYHLVLNFPELNLIVL